MMLLNFFYFSTEISTDSRIRLISISILLPNLNCINYNIKRVTSGIPYNYADYYSLVISYDVSSHWDQIHQILFQKLSGEMVQVIVSIVDNALLYKQSDFVTFFQFQRCVQWSCSGIFTILRNEHRCANVSFIQLKMNGRVLGIAARVAWEIKMVDSRDWDGKDSQDST